MGLPLLEGKPFLRHHFLADQIPAPGDPASFQRFYSLEIRPEPLAAVDGLVVLRPAVRRAAFARGAGDLVVIGRSGAGYDKVDLEACTENDVALFNAPLALNHPTASAALPLPLAPAQRLPHHEHITPQAPAALHAS